MAQLGPPEGAFHRAPRPLIGWVTVLLLLTCALFVMAVMGAIALGFWKTAAQGRGVPDMTGGLAALIAALVPAWGIAAQWLHTRSMERRTQMGVGQAPEGPFASSNSADGPRPGDSQ